MKLFHGIGNILKVIRESFKIASTKFASSIIIKQTMEIYDELNFND